MYSQIIRASSNFTKKTLESLGGKLKDIPGPVIDIFTPNPEPVQKPKVKLALKKSKIVIKKEDKDREYFRELIDQHVKLPDALIPIEKE